MGWSSNMSTTNQYIVYEIGITQNSQSITNNTSNVTVQVWVTRTNSGYTTYGTGTVYCRINGALYSASITPSQKITNSGIYIFSTTLNIPHNSDGTKTLTCSAWISHERFSSNEQSYSQTLSTIPRKSELAVSNGTLGTTQTLTVTRKSTSFTHTITYTCGSYSGTICDKSTSTSISWTPPLEFANGEPNGGSVYISLKIETFNGSTSIGSNTYSITCAIPTSVVPTVSFTVGDAMGYLSTYSAYVQTKSKFQIAITAAGVYSSTIKSYSTSVDGKTFSDSSFTTDVIKNSGTLTITVTVTDSRGRTATTSKTVTVLAYVGPKISSFSVKRCNSSGGSDSAGAYLGLTFSASITALNSKNTAAYVVKYKKKTDRSYTSATLSSYAGSYSVSNGTYVFAASTSSSYDVILEVTDAFSTANKSGEGSSITKLFSWLNQGLGWAFGKVAEFKDALEVAWNTYIRSNLHVNGSVMVKGSTDIDGKNLLRKTSSKWSNWVTPTVNTNNIGTNFFYGYDLGKLTKDTPVSISFDIEFSGVTASSSGAFKVYSQEVYYPNADNPSSAVYDIGPIYGAMIIKSPPTDGVYHYTKTAALTRDCTAFNRMAFNIRCDYWGSGKYRVRNVKFEVGSSPTDWAPAPEDSVFTVDGPATFNGIAQFNSFPLDYQGQPITNGLTMYTGSGDSNAIDPNSTLYNLILTDHSNGPDSGLYYIHTMFYNTKSATSNRAQYAFPYSKTAPMYTRYYYNGSWSEWNMHDSVVAEGTSGDWYYRKYASGWAELWAYKASSLTTIGGQSSTGYVLLHYPFALTSQPKYFASFGVNAQAFCWPTYVGANTESMEAYGRGNGSANGTVCWFSFYVAGKWK